MSDSQNPTESKPTIASLGNLDAANGYLASGELQHAWRECLEALRVRPFHPEAFFLMGKIALAGGDSKTARRCVDKAKRMAPTRAMALSFQCPAAGDKAKIDWPELEQVLSNSKTPTVSVCLIVKNEEAFLGKCLQSVRAFASQIIVVDTGSTDRTVAIAREQGAEVYFHPWNDDFSAARNAGLIHATGDWLLVMDADEELASGAADHLLRETRVPDVMAYQLPLINVGREQEGGLHLPRLFRNMPGCRYEGRVHEQFLHGMIQLTSGWGLKIASSQATLLHHGYTAEVTASRNKPQRNLRLLQQSLPEVANDPMSRAYLLMHMGLETVRTGNLAEGIDCYKEAVDLLNKLILEKKKGSKLSQEFRATLLEQYGSYLTRANRYREVISLYETPLAKSGSLSASDHYGLGLACGQVGEHEKAVTEFRACLAKRHLPATIPLHATILGTAPQQCLALALLALGRTTEAEQVYQEGLKQKPENLELRLHYARFKHQKGRSVEALKELHALLQNHAQNTELWAVGAEICLSHPQFHEIGLDWTSEALRLHPEVPALIALRAELLLLTGDLPGATGLARSLREKMGNNLNIRSIAFFVCCELFDGATPLPIDPQIEPQTSQAFLDLYQRLIAVGASDFIRQLNSRLDQMRPILPSAARLLTEALAQMDK